MQENTQTQNQENQNLSEGQQQQEPEKQPEGKVIMHFLIQGVAKTICGEPRSGILGSKNPDNITCPECLAKMQKYAELKAEAEADAEAELKADAEAKAKVEAETFADRLGDCAAELKADAEAEAKAKAEAETKAKPLNEKLEEQVREVMKECADELLGKELTDLIIQTVQSQTTHEKKCVQAQQAIVDRLGEIVEEIRQLRTVIATS